MKNIKRVAALGVCTALQTLGGAALAADWNVSGLIREEIAVQTSNDNNVFNQQGNIYNGVVAPNTGLGPFLVPGVAPTSFTRPASLTKNNTLNMLTTRVELNFDGKLTDDLNAVIKLRAVGDMIGSAGDAFKKHNLFEQEFRPSGAGTPLEAAGKNWMLDAPAAYLDYSSGPWWLRVGNQQIAWGESLFFRVADVANGLDLRRHLLTDVAAEEYSDKRVPSLGLRGSFRSESGLEVEGWTQQFMPSILPPENSPYNVIPSQFVIQQRDGYQEAKNFMNFGARLKAKFEDTEVSGFAVHRRNPDGVFRWTAATGPGAVPGTAFQAGTGLGVYSAAEWFNYASKTRLDGVGALDSALNDFPATTGLGALAVAAGCGATSAAAGAVRNNSASAGCLLNTFFDPVAGLGNLRGHLKREYPSESVFGFSVNRVFSGEPDSFTDQLIGRFELSYTPNKRFTNPTLSRDYIVENETNFAFIFEKYHKFSQDFPATYMVAQWMRKSSTDLFGRYVGGLENVPGSSPRGIKHSDAIAFAVQQPSPTLEWRGDLSILTDLQGGWMMQPGVKWRPSKSVQVDLYANMFRSSSSGAGTNFTETLKYGNEVFARVGYFF